MEAAHTFVQRIFHCDDQAVGAGAVYSGAEQQWPPQEDGDAGGKADVHGSLNLVSVQKEELKVVLVTELIPIFWGTGQVC